MNGLFNRWIICFFGCHRMNVSKKKSSRSVNRLVYWNSLENLCHELTIKVNSKCVRALLSSKSTMMGLIALFSSITFHTKRVLRFLSCEDYWSQSRTYKRTISIPFQLCLLICIWQTSSKFRCSADFFGGDLFISGELILTVDWVIFDWVAFWMELYACVRVCV